MLANRSMDWLAAAVSLFDPRQCAGARSGEEGNIECNRCTYHARIGAVALGIIGGETCDAQRHFYFIFLVFFFRLDLNNSNSRANRRPISDHFAIVIGISCSFSANIKISWDNRNVLRTLCNIAAGWDLAVLHASLCWWRCSPAACRPAGRRQLHDAISVPFRSLPRLPLRAHNTSFAGNIRERRSTPRFSLLGRSSDRGQR